MTKDLGREGKENILRAAIQGGMRGVKTPWQAVLGSFWCVWNVKWAGLGGRSDAGVSAVTSPHTL